VPDPLVAPAQASAAAAIEAATANNERTIECQEHHSALLGVIRQLIDAGVIVLKQPEPK